MHKKFPDKYPSELPPCITINECLSGKPILSTKNQYVLSLYHKVAGQQIVAGMGQPIGIIYQSILAIFDIYDIVNREERRELFEKITIIDSIRLKHSNSELINRKGKPPAKTKGT